MVVSKLLGSLEGPWREFPVLSCVVAQDGEDELLPFRPRLPV